MLAFSSVFKTYKGLTALRNVSFKLEKGEITVILGDNGAGKSTAIKLAAGIISPDSGEISLLGLPPKEKEARKLIGYLSENDELAENEEAFSLLKTVALIKGKDEKEAERVFLSCGLKKAAGFAIGKLSKGYKRRLALAAALIGRPPLLLLDEPIFGLDPIQTQETIELLKNAAKESAVLISTHLLDEAQSLADRILVFSKGELRADFKKEFFEKSDFLSLTLKVPKAQIDLSNIFTKLGALKVRKISNQDCDEYLLVCKKDLRKELLEELKKAQIEFLEIYSSKNSLKEKLKELI